MVAVWSWSLILPAGDDVRGDGGAVDAAEGLPDRTLFRRRSGLYFGICWNIC